MRAHTLTRLTLLLVALALTGCSSPPTEAPATVPTAPPSAIAATPATPTTLAQPDETKAPAGTAPVPTVKMGWGDVVSEVFETERALLRVSMRHDGTRNFAAWLVDESSGRRELLVNAIGAFEGAAYEGLAPGRYALEIKADGEWTFEIAQPVLTEGQTAPVTLTGTGRTAPDALQLTRGSARFELRHEGEENFAVWLYSAAGERVALLANEVGAYEGTRLATVPSSGIYVLDVTAGGAWSVAVRQ